MRIKNIKLIAFPILCFFMSNAFAQGGGILMGIQIGQSNLNNESMIVATGSNGTTFPAPTNPVTKETPLPACPTDYPYCQNMVLTDPSNTGFGIRLYGGAGFNRYVSVEAGLAYFTPSEYNPDVSYQTHEPKIREYAFDVLAKFTLPIKDFGIFAKGGIAAVYKSVSGALVADGEGTDDVYVRPEIGFGVSYSFSSLTVDISTNRISGNSDLEGINFTALGITYQIVDKYCGQFLC